MDSKRVLELGTKILEIQTLMIAYVTNGRTPDQPNRYRQLYDEVFFELEEAKYSIESCLMVLLDFPTGTLGKIIKNAGLDPDVERLVTQAYGLASNKNFVRHGGTQSSGIGKEEAEFFLEFSATAIVYITAKLKRANI